MIMRQGKDPWLRALSGVKLLVPFRIVRAQVPPDGDQTRRQNYSATIGISPICWFRSQRCFCHVLDLRPLNPKIYRVDVLMSLNMLSFKPLTKGGVKVWRVECLLSWGHLRHYINVQSSEALVYF
ncbi:hypothetical protein TNCV_4696121 [Trichonephila clavipes]|nr:hypothetical protein TNCV_4696121 [Trichonephila clavipes]